MSIVRLDHINIVTARFAETIAFYVDGLGLRRGALPGNLGDDNGNERGAWLYDSADIPIVHLIRDESAVASSSSPVDHFALKCVDSERFAARLAKQGIAFEASDYAFMNLRQLVVRDPNGLKVELNFYLAV